MNIRTVLNIYICIQTGRIIFQNFLFSLSAFAALSKFTIFFFLLLTVWSCSWHFCGDFLATCSMDNTSKIWDLNRLRTYMCLQWKQTIINTFLCYLSSDLFIDRYNIVISSKLCCSPQGVSSFGQVSKLREATLSCLLRTCISLICLAVIFRDSDIFFFFLTLLETFCLVIVRHPRALSYILIDNTN